MMTEREAESIGNERQREALRRAVSEQRAQAFILTGPRDIGKAAAAKAIAAELLGTKHLSGNVGFHEMLPDPELATDALGIWSVRAARQFLSLRVSGSGWKVLLIDDAERMTDAAANAFLKSLEEPPPQAVIFLVVEHPGALLPTIRSRAMQVPFRIVDDAAIRTFLTALGAPAEKAGGIASLAYGRPGLAKRLLEDDARLGAHQRRRDAALKLLDAPRFTRLAYSAKAQEQAPDAMRNLPEQWLPALRDKVRSGDVEACVFADRLYTAIRQLGASNARPEFVLDEALIS